MGKYIKPTRASISSQVVRSLKHFDLISFDSICSGIFISIDPVLRRDVTESNGWISELRRSVIGVGDSVIVALLRDKL